MAAAKIRGSGRGGFPWRIAGWGGAAAILLLPLIGNAPWTLSDYVAMGALLGGAGLVLELAARRSVDLAYRAGAGLAVAAAFLLVWVNLAVGFLGSEDNPANLMFLGVIAVAALGALFAGFRPAGMARALFAAAAAQVLVGGIGIAAGLGAPGPEGFHEAALGTSIFTALWLISGGLFLTAAGEAAAR
jgi:hypothetical protein